MSGSFRGKSDGPQKLQIRCRKEKYPWSGELANWRSPSPMVVRHTPSYVPPRAIKKILAIAALPVGRGNEGGSETDRGAGRTWGMVGRAR